MLKGYSLAQKKAAIIVFGIIVAVLGIVNRSFLENMVMSAVVVMLIVVFFLALIWFSIHSRSVTSKASAKLGGNQKTTTRHQNQNTTTKSLNRSQTKTYKQTYNT